MIVTVYEGVYVSNGRRYMDVVHDRGDPIRVKVPYRYKKVDGVVQSPSKSIWEFNKGDKARIVIANKDGWKILKEIYPA